MTTTLRFVFDAATQAALPQADAGNLATGDNLPVPDVGDSVSFGSLANQSFVVDERHYAFDGAGAATVTIKVTLASERSV